jgi:DNA-directed RNA polymerase subunit beta'
LIPAGTGFRTFQESEVHYNLEAMREPVSTPSQTLEDSFPLLESATPTSGMGDYGSSMSPPTIPIDGGASTEGSQAAPDALTALVEQGQTNGHDDLTLIEGVGPAIAELLRNHGLDSFATLSATNPVQIKQLLDANGFGAHDPSTWPDQSQLAAAGDWDKLKEWQSVLDGGRVTGDAAPVDDLTKIEGIGPAIAGHLNAAGITSFVNLAATHPDQIRAILDAVGGFAAHDPSTWPDQAQLAAAGDWDKLNEWQNVLDGGRISAEPDDLTKIEGVGPAIAELLNRHGIASFRDLAMTNPDRIREMLASAGGIIANANPSTWPDQAQLAAAGDWDRLKEWQDELDGGV